MSNWGGRREGAGRPRGSQNGNTKARREASRAVIERFETETPEAFQGNALALLQMVYRTQTLPLEVRIDAASKAIRFETPALGATLVRDVTPPASPAELDRRITELLQKGLRGAVTVIDG